MPRSSPHPESQPELRSEFVPSPRPAPLHPSRLTGAGGHDTTYGPTWDNGISLHRPPRDHRKPNISANEEKLAEKEDRTRLGDITRDRALGADPIRFPATTVTISLCSNVARLQIATKPAAGIGSFGWHATMRHNGNRPIIR